MCRKNMVLAAGLIGLGAGLLLGLCLESVLLRLILGLAAVGTGFGLLRTNRCA